MSLRESAAGGFRILAALKIIGTIVARVSAIAIAILLTPDDFGVFAIASFYVGLLTLLADFGLGTELVRRAGSAPGTLETAFTLRLVLAIGVIAATPVVALATGALYADSRLVLLIPVTALPILLSVFMFPSRTVALQRLQYGRAAIPDQAGKTAAPLITIGLALVGFGYWSLAYGAIGGAILAVALFQVAVPWRLGFRYEQRIARDVAGYGKYIMFAAIASFLAGTIDSAYLGYLKGTAVTGFYVVAVSWGVYLTSNLSSLLSGVTFPIFATVKDAVDRIRRGLYEVTRYYVYMAVFLSAGVLVLADPFVRSVLGETWAPAILPMQVLALSGFLTGLAQTAFDALTAVGQPKLVFQASLAQVIFLAVALPVAIIWQGIFGAAIVVTVEAGLAVVLSYRWVSRVFGFSLRTAFKPVALSWGVALLATPVVLVAEMVAGTGLLRFVALLVVYVAAFAALMILATRGAVLRESRALIRLVIGRG